jgi:hypothetical protein
VPFFRILQPIVWDSASIRFSRLLDSSNGGSVLTHLARTFAILCLVAASSAGAEAPPRVIRGPYLQSPAETSIVIRWRTDRPSDARVRFHTDLAALRGNGVALVAEDTTRSTEHEITISNLTPETSYFYAIGSRTTSLVGADADHTFRTSPRAGAERPVRIWVLGDSGTGGKGASRVRDAYLAFSGSSRTDVWLMLGDNAYPDGSDARYQKAVFDMYAGLLRKTALWPTRGNHDKLRKRSKGADYYDFFTLPTKGESGGTPSGRESFYSFDYGNVHFVCLNSEELAGDDDETMIAWVERDLSKSELPWTIAFWHQPPYSKGSHDSDDTKDGAGHMTRMRERVLPVLEKADVDLVLTGHSHAYERSFLLHGLYDKSSELESRMILDSGYGDPQDDGAYVKKDSRGTVYVVLGCSGEMRGGPLDHPAMARSLNKLGSLVIEVAGPALDAFFLDDQGKIQDRFRIEKRLRGHVTPDVRGASR